MADDSIFNTHADTYAVHSDTNAVNRDYDRPTILRLIGDVDGHRVFEFGFAAG